MEKLHIFIAGLEQTERAQFVGLLGVSSKDCSIDYELTSFSGREARLRTEEFKRAMDYVTSIGHVNDMKDGILRWCEKSGISIDLINNFRKAIRALNLDLRQYRGLCAHPIR